MALMKNLNFAAKIILIVNGIFFAIPVLSVPDHEIRTECFYIRGLYLVGQYYYSSNFTEFPCRIIHGSGTGNAHWQITANGNKFSYSYSGDYFYVNNKKRNDFDISYRSSLTRNDQWQIPTRQKENEIMDMMIANDNITRISHWCFVDKTSKTAFCARDNRDF
jgi:hypothetical protein